MNQHIILSSYRHQTTGVLTHVRANSSFSPATDNHQIKLHRPELKKSGREFRAAALEVTAIRQSPLHNNDLAISIKKKGTAGPGTDWVYINRDPSRDHRRDVGFVTKDHWWLTRKISELPLLKSSKMPKWIQSYADLPKVTAHATPKNVTMVQIDPDHVFMRVKSGFLGSRREYYTMTKSAFDVLYTPR